MKPCCEQLLEMSLSQKMIFSREKIIVTMVIIY